MASMPNGKLWEEPCRNPRRALKKSATEGHGRNSTDRGGSGGKIRLYVEGRGIPLGVTATGANVHDSRLIGVPLRHSREMAAGFGEQMFVISVWTRGMIIRESARKSALTNLRNIPAAGGRSPGALEVSYTPLGGRTNIHSEVCVHVTVASSSVLWVYFTLRRSVFSGET